MAEVSGWKAFSTQPFIERVLIMIHMIHCSFMRGSPWRSTLLGAVALRRICALSRAGTKILGVLFPSVSLPQCSAHPFQGLSYIFSDAYFALEVPRAFVCFTSTFAI